jgi:hypothetical protein
VVAERRKACEAAWVSEALSKVTVQACTFTASERSLAGNVLKDKILGSLTVATWGASEIVDGALSFKQFPRRWTEVTLMSSWRYHE